MPEKGVRPETLQLDISPNSVPANGFSQKDRPTIAELRHEVSELMSRIGHGKRLGAFRNPIAGENLHPAG